MLLHDEANSRNGCEFRCKFFRFVSDGCCLFGSISIPGGAARGMNFDTRVQIIAKAVA
jgi:hypothetical protein